MKNKRQNQILEIIAREDVETQERLMELLQERGISCTQATISRDIKQLHLVKEPVGRGRYRYAAYVHRHSLNVADKLRTIFRESIVSVDYAQNIADSSTLRVEHLPSYLTKNLPAVSGKTASAPGVIDFSNQSLQGLLDDYEHQILLQALDHCGYNISRTAEMLGILRQSLQYRIRKYGIVI